MKFPNPILNFERTHGQTQSNVPLQLFKTRGGGIKTQDDSLLKRFISFKNVLLVSIYIYIYIYI